MRAPRDEGSDDAPVEPGESDRVRLVKATTAMFVDAVMRRDFIDFLKVLLADSIRKRLTLRIVMYLNRISAAILLVFGAAIIIITLLNIDFGLSKDPPEAPGIKTGTVSVR